MAARAPGAPARHAAGFLSKLSRRSFAEFLDRGPLVEAKFSHASKLPNFLTTHSAMSMKRPKPPSAASSLSSDDSDRMRDGSGSALLRRNRSPKKNCFGFLGCGGGGGSDALEPAAAPAASAAAAAYDAAAASDVDVVGGSVAAQAGPPSPAAPPAVPTELSTLVPFLVTPRFILPRLLVANGFEIDASPSRDGASDGDDDAAGLDEAARLKYVESGAIVTDGQLSWLAQRLVAELSTSRELGGVDPSVWPIVRMLSAWRHLSPFLDQAVDMPDSMSTATVMQMLDDHVREARACLEQWEDQVLLEWLKSGQLWPPAGAVAPPAAVVLARVVVAAHTEANGAVPGYAARRSVAPPPLKELPEKPWSLHRRFSPSFYAYMMERKSLDPFPEGGPPIGAQQMGQFRTPPTTTCLAEWDAMAPEMRDKYMLRGEALKAKSLAALEDHKVLLRERIVQKAEFDVRLVEFDSWRRFYVQECAGKLGDDEVDCKLFETLWRLFPEGSGTDGFSTLVELANSAGVGNCSAGVVELQARSRNSLICGIVHEKFPVVEPSWQEDTIAFDELREQAKARHVEARAQSGETAEGKWVWDGNNLCFCWWALGVVIAQVSYRDFCDSFGEVLLEEGDTLVFNPLYLDIVRHLRVINLKEHDHYNWTWGTDERRVGILTDELGRTTIEVGDWDDYTGNNRPMSIWVLEPFTTSEGDEVGMAVGTVKGEQAAACNQEERASGSWRKFAQDYCDANNIPFGRFLKLNVGESGVMAHVLGLLGSDAFERHVAPVEPSLADRAHAVFLGLPYGQSAGKVGSSLHAIRGLDGNATIVMGTAVRLLSKVHRDDRINLATDDVAADAFMKFGVERGGIFATCAAPSAKDRQNQYNCLVGAYATVSAAALDPAVEAARRVEMGDDRYQSLKMRPMAEIEKICAELRPNNKAGTFQQHVEERTRIQTEQRKRGSFKFVDLLNSFKIKNIVGRQVERLTPSYWLLCSLVFWKSDERGDSVTLFAKGEEMEMRKREWVE